MFPSASIVITERFKFFKFLGGFKINSPFSKLTFAHCGALSPFLKMAIPFCIFDLISSGKLIMYLLSLKKGFGLKVSPLTIFSINFLGLTFASLPLIDLFSVSFILCSSSDCISTSPS